MTTKKAASRRTAKNLSKKSRKRKSKNLPNASSKAATATGKSKRPTGPSRLARAVNAEPKTVPKLFRILLLVRCKSRRRSRSRTPPQNLLISVRTHGYLPPSTTQRNICHSPELRLPKLKTRSSQLHPGHPSTLPPFRRHSRRLTVIPVAPPSTRPHIANPVAQLSLRTPHRHPPRKPGSTAKIANPPNNATTSEDLGSCQLTK